MFKVKYLKTNENEINQQKKYCSKNIFISGLPLTQLKDT